MKKILYTLVAVAAMVGVSCDKTSEIKVMSYNIRYLNDKDGDNHWDNRKQASINMINDEKPTVFGLQEAVKAQVDFLAENLPDYAYYGVGRDDGKEKGEYMAIFYNKDEVELLKKDTFWLSETPDEPSKGWDAACFRTCTWTIFKCKDSGKQFAYFNTHLDHKGKQAKAEGMKLLAAKVKELVPEDMPVFMNGDFNSRPDNEIFEPLRAVLADARDVATVTDRRATRNAWKKGGEDNLNRVIDHIFFRGAEAHTFKVLRDKDYGVPFISDHYPVVMTASF